MALFGCQARPAQKLNKAWRTLSYYENKCFISVLIHFFKIVYTCSYFNLSPNNYR